MTPVLIFDGDCGFCTTSARFIESYLPSQIRVEPWQGLDLGDFGLTIDDVSTAAYWADDTGIHRGHLAVAKACTSASGEPHRFFVKAGFSVAGWASSTPPFSWLAKPVYRLVAKHRHKLPGGTAACKLSPPPSTSTNA